MASTRFQRWAAAFPLTRRIAQRRARALFDICAGFVYSQVLFACVELGLFELLSAGPMTTATLAERLELAPKAAARLLAAAVSLGLVERRGADRFGLGPLGAALRGNPAIAAMVAHHSVLYADLQDPVALLRGSGVQTRLGRFWSYASADIPASLPAERVADYTSLMSTSQALIGADVLDAYPLTRHRCLLDIGGGDGTFLIAAAGRAPKLRVILFDLPAVAERARARFAERHLEPRATAIGGDFLADPLPTGADIVSLVRVMHDHDDAAALTILRAARDALGPTGMVLIAEPMSGTSGAQPVADAYFGLYLLAMGHGRARTFKELSALLEAAGFTEIWEARTRRPMLTRLVLARPSPREECVNNY